MNRRRWVGLLAALLLLAAWIWSATCTDRSRAPAIPAEAARSAPHGVDHGLDSAATDPPPVRTIAADERATTIVESNDVTLVDAQGNVLPDVATVIGSHLRGGSSPWLSTWQSSPSGVVPVEKALAAKSHVRDSPSLLIKPLVIGKEPTHEEVKRGEAARVVVPSPGALLIRFHAEPPVTSQVSLVLRIPEDGERKKQQLTIWSVDRGQVRVPCELNLQGTVTASAEDHSRSGAAAEFIGPTRTGQTVTVDLDLGALVPMLVVRVEREDGSTPTRDEIAIQHAFVDDPSDFSDTQWNAANYTYADGVARIAYTYGSAAGAAHLRFAERQASSEAIVRAPESLQRGDNSIGKVTLRQTPIALLGRVVDEGGRPVWSARVWIYQQTPDVNTTNRPIRAKCVTTRDGTFEWRSSWTGTVSVSAHATQFCASEKQQVDIPSSQPIELVLPPEIRVYGEVLVDDAAMLPLCYVEARLDDRLRSTEIYGTDFVINGVPTTNRNVTARVMSQGLDWPLTSEQTESTPLAAKLSLDARGAIRVLDTQVVNAEGKPRSNEIVRVSHPDEKSATVRLDPSGRLKLALPIQLDKIEIEGEAKQSVVVSTHTPPATVRVP